MNKDQNENYKDENTNETLKGVFILDMWYWANVSHFKWVYLQNMKKLLG